MKLTSHTAHRIFYCGLLLFSFITLIGHTQTPVLRPRPLTIDLANPQAGIEELSKDEKKKWKEIQKQKKKELKLKDKYYQYKWDSVQLANYEKYQQIQLPDSLPTKDLYSKDKLLEELKSKYNLPDTTTLTDLSDSSFVQQMPPDLQKALVQELASYTNLEIDSTWIISQDSLITMLTDSTHLLKDSIGNLSGQAAYTYGESAFQDKAEQHLGKYSDNSLAPADQQEEMMFSSYEDMIASEKYQELMASMPGKKKEIESALNDPTVDPQDLPIPESVFEGHEDQLAKAMATKTVVQQKSSCKEILKQLVNQDMTSIQEKTTIQRFSLSGYIQIAQYDPLLIDYSPNISFAITGRTRIGTGATGRVKFGNGPDDDKDLFGYRGFLEYDLFKNFYLHGEYERTGLIVKDLMSEVERRQWSDRWLLGLGMDIKLPSILKGTLLVLYNFESNLANSPNPRRFQIRYGVKLN